MRVTFAHGLSPCCALQAPSFATDANLEAARFGEHVFKGEVATRYLSKYGETANLLADSAWTATKSDLVASAILDWARDNGASVYTHWCVRIQRDSTLAPQLTRLCAAGSSRWAPPASATARPARCTTP